MRIGRKERCVVCGGSGLVNEQQEPVVYLSTPAPRGRVSLCTECKARGSVLYVWHGLRCVPLAKLPHSVALQEQVGLG